MSATKVLPVKKPDPSRKTTECLSFNEDDIIIPQMQGFLEFQFEELRLRDYKAPKLDIQLSKFETSPHFSSIFPDDQDMADPTINTKFAMEDLMSAMAGTPTLSMSRAQLPSRPLPEVSEPTAAFDAGTIQFAVLQQMMQAAGDRQERRHSVKLERSKHAEPSIFPPSPSEIHSSHPHTSRVSQSHARSTVANDDLAGPDPFSTHGHHSLDPSDLNPLALEDDADLFNILGGDDFDIHEDTALIHQMPTQPQRVTPHKAMSSSSMRQPLSARKGGDMF